MDEASSKSEFWGLLDRVNEGLSSTGSSVLKGAGELVNTYEHYFGGKASSTPREEHTVDRANELRETEPLGSPAWYQQPGYVVAVAVGVGVLVLLLSRLK